MVESKYIFGILKYVICYEYFFQPEEDLCTLFDASLRSSDSPEWPILMID